jgi:hypothetical protein
MGKIRVGRAGLQKKGAWVTGMSFIDFAPASQSNLSDKRATPLAPGPRSP